LLVDDDVTVRRLLTRYFVDLGFHVFDADNPYAALGRMSDGPFELVVTDIDMPERSGLWLVEELRGRARDLPLIVMTGGELQKAGIRALYGPDVRLLRKPFELKELEAVLQEMAPQLFGDNEVAASFHAPEPEPADNRPYAYASAIIGEMLARTVGLPSTSLPWQGGCTRRPAARRGRSASGFARRPPLPL
jgi:DNA-binding NtrC family response regulator